MYKIKENQLISVTVVSKHNKKQLKKLENTANIKPVINQIECHPRLQQDALINFCKERDIAVTAWGPLGRGRLLPDDHLAQLAKKYNKTAEIGRASCREREKI